MANMNLATQSSNSDSGDGFSFSRSGLLGAFFFFISASFLWGGLIFWNKIIEKETVDLQEKYSQKYNSFANSDAKDVTDFKNRLNFAKDSYKKVINVREALDKTETLLIPGEVWLGSFAYDEKTNGLILSCRARNYKSVATQILSFKKSDYFSSVLGGKSQMDRATGVISFEINLTFK